MLFLSLLGLPLAYCSLPLGLATLVGLHYNILRVSKSFTLSAIYVLTSGAQAITALVNLYEEMFVLLLAAA